MFVFYYTQFLYQKFMNIGDGGFNMASKGFVSELPMYYVDLSVQNEFATFANQVDKSKVAVHNKFKKMLGSGMINTVIVETMKLRKIKEISRKM